MSKVYELVNSKTNIFLIEGTDGSLLFDTGWAGSMDALERSLHEIKKSTGDIGYVLMSHYHPDHCGLAQELADKGAVILALGLQVPFLHSADEVYAKGTKPEYRKFRPIDDSKVRVISPAESRGFLDDLGIQGEILHTPGHSDDSVTLLLDDGFAFVGDLNPIYELELHNGTQIEASWDKILSHKLKTVYYGHARKHVLEEEVNDTAVAGDAVTTGKNADQTGTEDLVSDQSYESGKTQGFFKKIGLVLTGSDKKNMKTGKIVGSDNPEKEQYNLVSGVMRLIDKGTPIDVICKKTGADKTLIEDITRMYLTHPGVGVQGILDRIEIKGR